MVSSGTVTGDASNLSNIMSQYTSSIDGVSGHWTGKSYDSFESMTSEFSSSFPETINSQLTSFASACESYEKYEQLKKDLKAMEEQKASMAASGESSGMATINNEIATTEKEINSLKSQIQSYLSEAGSTKLEATKLSSIVSSASSSTGTNGLSSVNGGGNHLADGASYWQVQGTGDNCAMTAFLVGVNTLLGENKYTDNVGEYNNIGGNTETLGWTGDNRSVEWIESHGLSDKIEVTGIENIHSREDLQSHLRNGEVVVASSTGTVFKRNDGSKEYYDHYITFYGIDDQGNCYANDSATGDSSQAAGVQYTPEDVDEFYAVGNHGSITMKAK